MKNNEIMQIVGSLTTLKSSILYLNDYLLLNMESNTYYVISNYLTNEVEKINNIIEKLNEMDNLVSEYDLTAINSLNINL